jgi:hypothetical protein
MIQILMILLFVVPVFLATASGAICTLLDRAGPRPLRAKSGPAQNRDTSSTMKRHAAQLRATRLRAVIGLVSYVLAFLLAIGDGVALSVCDHSSAWSGLSSNLLLSLYIIPGASFITLLTSAATFSVFCLWRTYLRDRTESLDMANGGERCSNDGSTITSPGLESV